MSIVYTNCSCTYKETVNDVSTQAQEIKTVKFQLIEAKPIT